MLLTGWLIGRSRLGLALRVIGEDEVVARHAGIDTTRAKLVMFAVSALFMTLTGAVMAPRWTYIDPAIAFNPMLSFEVVIMALFGGAGVLFGPILGVVPFVLLFEFLSANFPNYFSILLGLVFLAIVYALPQGVVGLRAANACRARQRRQRAAAAGRRQDRGRASWKSQSLRKAFGGLVAVDDLGFAVTPGEIVGLIGPNGSGKTTVLNLISGALPADAGSVRCDRQTITGRGAHRIARLGVARTFQLVRVLDIHDGGRERHGRARLSRRAAARRRGGSRGARPARPRRPCRQGRSDRPRSSPISTRSDSSWRARWRSIRACCCSTNGSPVSIATELEQGIALIRSLRGDGLTIVLVEHVMDAIRSLCDRCIVMNAGARSRRARRRPCSPTARWCAPISGRPMLEVAGLSVFYGKHQALTDVALPVRRGGDRRDPRRQRRRQDHPAQGDRRPGAAAARRADRPQRTAISLCCSRIQIVEAGVALVPEGRGIFAS